MRFNIINNLIKENGYKKYLEIGVDSGYNFNQIEVDEKVGVDPKSEHATEHLTSDEFFKKNRKKFDIIFIDGLHHADQVEKDIENSLKYLKKGGVIVCHDMKPETKEEQIVPRMQKVWTGDCWRAWVKLRKRDDLEMFVYDIDHGVGIIREGSQEPKDFGDLTYEEFSKNISEYLNLKEYV